jgi:hypothetical protein
MVVMAAVIGFVAVVGADAADTPDISTIMKKVNSGKGLQKALAKDLQAPTVNWADAAKKSKEIYELVSSLPKNEPPKGDKTSWEKHTKEYVANAKALNEACEKKDKNAATGAAMKMGRACMMCHNAHKG